MGSEQDQPSAAGTAIEGRARRPDGGPVPEARVLIVAAPVDVPDVALLTDEEGRFRLHVPAPGVYEVACHAEGFAPATLRVEAPASGGEILLEFRLTPAP